MSRREHHTDYDEETTARCERALVTLLGDLGPWSDRIYLAGGLAPRYLVGQLPEGARAHVGTTDIDLVIGLALGDETPETYRTLQENLLSARFERKDPSFRWARKVEGVTVIVEFLCETDEVPFGRIFRPKEAGEFTGSRLGAFNVRGAHLVRDDFIECDIERERLDNGGVSRVTVRVANVLPYLVLKILAFQDRHENKDAYDLVFTLFNHARGPRVAGESAATSPVAEHAQVTEALTLLGDRFRDSDQDGPSAYALFLAEPGDGDERARLRQEASRRCASFSLGFATRARTREIARYDGLFGALLSDNRLPYLYVTAKNIKSDGISLDGVSYVSAAAHREIYARCDPEKGDILYIKDGATTGVVTVNNLDEPFSMLSSVALLKLPSCVHNRLLVTFLRSPFFYDQMRGFMKGAALPRVTLKRMAPALLPLPPQAEQHRIVAKVDELMRLCDGLEQSLDAVQTGRARLLDAVLHEALESLATP